MRLLPILLVVLCSFLVTRLSSLGLRSPISEAPVYSISASLPPPLEPNERIRDNLLREFPGQVVAPEHFAFSKDGGIYFGVADGRIMRTRADVLTGALGPLETVVQLGSRWGVDRAHPCGSEQSEPLCGRALGMAFDAQGTLIVADCYLGLIAVDVHNKTRRVLLDEVDGTPLYFANSVAIGPKSGIIYFTDSSSRWRRSDFLLEVMESAPTGRLVAYDPSTGHAQVLVQKVSFTNGLLVDTLEEQYLLMVELGRARILRIDLPKTRALPALPIDWATEQTRLASDASSSSAVSVLIDNLPGIPDNLSWEEGVEGEGVGSSSGHGRRFWVGCGTARKGPLSLTDLLAPYPRIRQALVWILPKSVFLRLVPRVGLLLRMQLHDDKDQVAVANNKVVVAAAKATIVESLQDNSGRLALLTCAYEHQGFVYLGAISHEVDFIPRIPWTKENRTRVDVVEAAPKPTKL